MSGEAMVTVPLRETVKQLTQLAVAAVHCYRTGRLSVQRTVEVTQEFGEEAEAVIRRLVVSAAPTTD